MNNEDMRILYNTILIVCWTALAIAFGKWWLIFLAIIFWGFKPD